MTFLSLNRLCPAIYFPHNFHMTHPKIFFADKESSQLPHWNLLNCPNLPGALLWVGIKSGMPLLKNVNRHRALEDIPNRMCWVIRSKGFLFRMSAYMYMACDAYYSRICKGKHQNDVHVFVKFIRYIKDQYLLPVASSRHCMDSFQK
jgi:hypothetical protein